MNYILRNAPALVKKYATTPTEIQTRDTTIWVSVINSSTRRKKRLICSFFSKSNDDKVHFLNIYSITLTSYRSNSKYCIGKYLSIFGHRVEMIYLFLDLIICGGGGGGFSVC